MAPKRLGKRCAGSGLQPLRVTKVKAPWPGAGRTQPVRGICKVCGGDYSLKDRGVRVRAHRVMR